MNESSKVRCHTCGDEKAKVYLRPFGKDPNGRPRTWVCDRCETLTAASQAEARMSGKAPILFTTVLRAERLAVAGHGWTADEVLRNAMDLLEGRTVLRGEGR